MAQVVQEALLATIEAKIRKDDGFVSHRQR